MIPRPHHRYSQPLLALLLVCLTGACRSVPEPTPTPTVHTSPTATSHPVQARSASVKALATATPISPTDTPLTGAATLSSFILPLPADWYHLLLTEASYRAQVQSLVAINPAFQIMAEQLFQGQETAPQLLIGWPADRAQNVGLVAYVIPRRDLTLQNYQRAITHALSTAPTIALVMNTIDYDLRDDVPIGYLHYRLVAPEQPTVLGYHYWLMNSAADELLLLTFVMNGQALTATTTDQAPSPFATLVQQVTRSPELAE